jgi:hypothetical protein
MQERTRIATTYAPMAHRGLIRAVLLIRCACRMRARPVGEARTCAARPRAVPGAATGPPATRGLLRRLRMPVLRTAGPSATYPSAPYLLPAPPPPAAQREVCAAAKAAPRRTPTVRMARPSTVRIRQDRARYPRALLLPAAQPGPSAAVLPAPRRTPTAAMVLRSMAP